MRLNRAALWPVGASLLATLALAAMAVPSALGGFSATIASSGGSAGSGTLLLQEGLGATICISTGNGTSSSSSIVANDNSNCPLDLFASTNLAPYDSTATPGSPGSAASATVHLTNAGSLAGSSLTLTPGHCTVGDNLSPGGISNTYFGTDTAGFCGKIDATIENDTGGKAQCVFPSASTSACPAPSASGNLANLATETLPALASHASATYTVTVALDPSATNADQGLLATVPLTWTLNQ